MVQICVDLRFLGYLCHTSLCGCALIFILPLPFDRRSERRFLWSLAGMEHGRVLKKANRKVRKPCRNKHLTDEQNESLETANFSFPFKKKNPDQRFETSRIDGCNWLYHCLFQHNSAPPHDVHLFLKIYFKTIKFISPQTNFLRPTCRRLPPYSSSVLTCAYMPNRKAA